MEAGRIIGGKYRLRREIGKGAMGSVWAAMHESLGRAVAVKFLHPTGVNPDTASARFVAEARMAAAVKHRFVVDIFDFGITEDGVSYMVLELLEGEELGERMYYGPPMLITDAVRFVSQCLGGLTTVHKAGIVHRDLKPENIFLMQDADGQFPKLLDFGISKRSAGRAQLTGMSVRPPRMGGRPTQLTQPGTVIGTPWYMAPEQLRGRRDIDARADIYGMGVILWEWLTGRVPHDEDNIGDLMVSVMGTAPPDLRAIRPELGGELWQVLQKAMAVKREKRFQSAQEMRDALMATLPELPQAWTVVQKSIANLSSKEVLGVAFPSEAPTNRTDHPGAPTAPPPIGNRTIQMTEPGLVQSLIPPGIRGNIKRAKRNVLVVYYRAPGYVVAAGLSVFLLLNIVLFSEVRSGDATPGAAPDTSLADQADLFEPAISKGNSVQAAAPMDLDFELGAVVDAGMEDANIDASLGDGGDGARLNADANIGQAPVSAAQRRAFRRRRAKKKKKLIRNLDF